VTCLYLYLCTSLSLSLSFSRSSALSLSPKEDLGQPHEDQRTLLPGAHQKIPTHHPYTNHAYTNLITNQRVSWYKQASLPPATRSEPFTSIREWRNPLGGTLMSCTLPGDFTILESGYIVQFWFLLVVSTPAFHEDDAAEFDRLFLGFFFEFLQYLGQDLCARASTSVNKRDHKRLTLDDACRFFEGNAWRGPQQAN